MSELLLLKETLYHKEADGIWRRVIRQFEKPDTLGEAQCGIVGGALCRGQDNLKDMEQQILVADYNELRSGVFSAMRFLSTYGAT